MRLSAQRLAIAFGLVSLVATAARAAEGPRPTARAVRAHDPPTIDGALDDPVWAGAPWHGGFVQKAPLNGQPATLETSFAVAFDEEQIYFAVRSAVPNRDAVIARLTRRDRGGDFDAITIYLSPRGDRRTGYSFRVNAAGVQRDVAWRNDNVGQSQWDAVWSGAARVGEREWTAELAIPLDELRFPEGRDAWGLQVVRWISGRQERAVWSPVPSASTGWISNSGQLVGVGAIEPVLPLSATPEAHLAYRETSDDFDGRAAEGLEWGIGGYARAGLGSDLTLDLAVHPDFGQVEVDAAVLNLSAYETRFPEKRPFFLEGAGIFSTPLQLFYSRRLGAPPADPSLEGDEAVHRGPTSTPILAAAKLTGRATEGLSVGIIEAVTMPTEFVLESAGTGDRRDVSGSPWTSATVLRLNSEVSSTSSFGLTATALQPRGRDGSYSGGLDWILRTDDREYALRGQVAGSARLEEHNGREAGNGAGVWVRAGREGGEHLRLTGTYEAYSKGLDLNDLGYLRRDDYQRYKAHLQLRQMKPVGPWLEVYAGVQPSGARNTDGLDLGHMATAYVETKWRGNWWTELGGFARNRHLDDRETRGGPPLPRAPIGGFWYWARTDARRLLAARLSGELHNTAYGYGVEAKLMLELRTGRLELDAGPGFARHTGRLAWVETLDDGGPDETTIIARRDLDELNLSASGTLAITLDLTFQLSAQLLSAHADYTRYQELTAGGARLPYARDGDADFAAADLRLLALLRWEYLPGCAAYLIYTHLGLADADGDELDLGEGLGAVRDEQREQLFMIKLSHRFG